MKISELRQELEAARGLLAQGNSEEARQCIEHALEELQDRLLTTTEAKDLLGIGSVNTLKLLVRKAGLRTESRGNRMMIPLSELETLQHSPLVRGLQSSDRLHDTSTGLGSEHGLSSTDLDALEEGRPGTAPWDSNQPAAV